MKGVKTTYNQKGELVGLEYWNQHDGIWKHHALTRVDPKSKFDYYLDSILVV